jgi:hypothetical protein
VEDKSFRRFTTLENFFFETPLYETLEFNEESWKQASGIWERDFVIDGYCTWCQKDATFTRQHRPALPHPSNYKTSYSGAHEVVIECARTEFHAYTFHLRKYTDKIFKTGQWPSLADIQFAALKDYRKILSKEDNSELHRAIGLAAHGVGVGAFVYLRRVLERLLERTFEAGEKAHNWRREEYQRLRTTERISMMKEVLPDFLVENARIYGILSKGIHELSEDECRGVFTVLKAAIVEILEDERQAAEKLARRKAITQVLSDFGSK